jgi:tetratricopeptide (TPR) repeat protein
MPEDRLFVGRQAELAQWDRVLADPRGQAVLVLGQQGMGKTWLIDRMAKRAAEHPDYRCGAVRYEVTPTDSVDSTLALMLDHAFEAARIGKPLLSGTEKQWQALFSACKLIPVVGEKAAAIGELAMSLRRDPARNTRDQFLKGLSEISRRMPDNGRAIFIIDPEKYMQPDSDQAWAIVARQLPAKIKLVFAQRPDDALAQSAVFAAIDNVVRIPDDDLGDLDAQAVEDLVKARASSINRTIPDLLKAVARYHGHPFAVPAALDLIQDGLSPDRLPADPTKGIAAEQWRRVCQQSEQAIRLLKAYAVLEVAVPDDVACPVADLTADQLQHLLAERFVGTLVRQEPDGRRIYHSLLADHIREQLTKQDAKPYHRRAIDEFSRRLREAEEQQTKPDALAAVRLPEHVLAVDGVARFLDAFVHQCTAPLLRLGFLDAAFSLSHRALDMAPAGSAEHAAIMRTLGIVWLTLDGAEAMHRKALEFEQKLGRLEGMYRKALEIDEKLGRLQGMADDYSNLGVMLDMRGDLDGAEAMYRKALEIDEKLGRLEGMANAYGGLGIVLYTRDDLDGAEAMHRKALDINRKLGRLEGMARDYDNLGFVVARRRDIAAAHELWTKARDLFAKIGMAHRAKRTQGLLDAFPKEGQTSQ